MGNNVYPTNNGMRPKLSHHTRGRLARRLVLSRGLFVDTAAHGFSHGDRESTKYSSPPPLKRRPAPLTKIQRSIRNGVLAVSALLILTIGCVPPENQGESPDLTFNNTTDPTNAAASYVGSAACGACHPSVAALTLVHAHSQALSPIQGRAPEFADEGIRAGVPNPPAGMTWNDVSYVISGYLHGAYFVDSDGFVATDGVAGVNTQWNLNFPANGTETGFTAFLPAQATPLPYDYETCFRCHTTGPRAQDADDPRSQDGRPGILGTWAESGVRCEACHGPGSSHVPSPDTRNIFVDSTPKICGGCHTDGDDPDVIVVSDGFLAGNSQYPQLLASGGHSDFNCTVCHDPHASITYDRDNGLRNDCTVCHVDANLAFHDGAVFELGDFAETINCQSCHMPLAGLSTSFAPPVLVGPTARIGDVRAHIFRIDTENAGVDAMFTADGGAVRKDADGKAAVTVNYVCLRCHNEAGAVFPLTLEGARMIANGIHARAADADE